MRKHRSGNARSSTAPPSLRKALPFSSPPDAAISPASNDDDDDGTNPTATPTPTPTLSSVEPEGRPREIIATEEESSPSFVGPASPPASTITTTEVASYSPSTWGSAAKNNGDLPEPEVSAGVAGQDAKAASAAAPEFLVWARSTATSSSADDLSKKVAAAVLKALEDGAATAAGEGKGRGRLDPLLFLAKVNIAVLCFLLLMSWVMFLLCLSSSGGCLRRDWLPYPPPT